MKIIILSIIILINTACNSSSNKNAEINIYNIAKELENKQIIFPNKLEASANGARFYPYVTGESKFKVVVYTDSLGCTPCKFKSGEWAYIMRQLHSLTDSIYFVLIFEKESPAIEEELVVQGVDCPVIYDTLCNFAKTNNIPQSPLFHTFLLDKDNRIILQGSPLNNKKIWELYKERIKQ